MQSFLFKLSPLVVSLILASCPSVAGQTHASSQPSTKGGSATSALDWETLRPDGEQFSVLIPKGSTFESSKEPYHKMELNTRVYLSNIQGGPVFAVVSLSGIKSNPAMYSEMQRVNSYVDAFKTFFPPKVRKDAVAKLTLVGDKTLQGNAGREYRISIGDLSGLTQVYATRKRFYAIVYLNSKKDDAIQDQFLGSFVIPDYVAETPSPPVAQTPAANQPNPQPTIKPGGGEIPESEAGATPKNDPAANGSDPAAPTSAKKAPISGGVLNGKAYSLPTPDYPADARAAGASGTVTVQVTIDEQGNVLSAYAVSGHPLLQKPSVIAAFRAKFAPTLLMGEPVKVTGVILYNFGTTMN